MNMQVSAPAAGLPVPPPVHLDDTDEAIIRLLRAYDDGIAAYNAGADDDLRDEQCSELAAKTYEPPLNQLRENPPAILTAAGAVAATRFMRNEIRDFKDTEDLLPLLDRLQDFLESAAGTALVHRDADLLALGGQIDALTARIDANSAFHNSLTAECDRQFEDVPSALKVGEFDLDWFGQQVTSRGELGRWHPDDAAEVKTPTSVFIGTLSAAQERAAQIREAGAAHMARYEAWQDLVGLTANEAEYIVLTEQLDDLHQKALSLRPASLAGAAVQAKIVHRENPHLFSTEPDDYDTGEKETVDFINNLLRWRADR